MVMRNCTFAVHALSTCHCSGQRNMLCGPSSLVCPVFDFFVAFVCLSMSRHLSCGHLAVASSGAPPTTFATSDMAHTGAHSRGGCHSPSSTGIVDSTPAASPGELFSRDDLLVLVFGMS